MPATRAFAQDPDHYDPDDTKTWADVAREDRDVDRPEDYNRLLELDPDAELT